MQRGNGGRDDFNGFGDPFAGFGNFGRPGSLISSIFGGRDPFDDPFFNRPFGSMLGPSMFGPSMFGTTGHPFGHPESAGFIEDQAPQPNKSKGPVITELNSDGEEEVGEEDNSIKEKKENGRKHSRSGKEPYVQDPDEEVEEKKIRHTQYRNNSSNAGSVRPWAQTYSFQSSTVTYGGPNGAYYTSSTTRRAGGDGVSVEESKEADTTTGKATHRISRGLRNRGHSVARKLNSDGKVDTTQILHNLDEDDLADFDEAWKGNAKQHLPRWNQGLDMLDNGNRRGGSSSGHNAGGWALPSSGNQQYPGQRGPPSRRA